MHHGATETLREKINGIFADPVVHFAVSSRTERRYFGLVSPAEKRGHGKEHFKTTTFRTRATFIILPEQHAVLHRRDPSLRAHVRSHFVQDDKGFCTTWEQRDQRASANVKAGRSTSLRHPACFQQPSGPLAGQMQHCRIIGDLAQGWSD